MKNKIALLGIIALLFSLLGCGGSGGNPGGGSDDDPIGYLGKTLVFNNVQVYSVFNDDDTLTPLDANMLKKGLDYESFFILTDFPEPLSLTDAFNSSSVKLTGQGKANITVGTPKNPISISIPFGSSWAAVAAANDGIDGTTKVFFLSGFVQIDVVIRSILTNAACDAMEHPPGESDTADLILMKGSSLNDTVWYAWVDKDLILKFTDGDTSWDFDFKAGWNQIVASYDGVTSEGSYISKKPGNDMVWVTMPWPFL